MQNEHPLLLLVNRQLCHLGGDIIWKCTLSCTDDRICKIKSTFVKQIVMATANLEIDRSLKETIIWNNKYICIQNNFMVQLYSGETGEMVEFCMYQTF